MPSSSHPYRRRAVAVCGLTRRVLFREHAGYSNVQMSFETYCRRIIDDQPESGFYLALVPYLMQCSISTRGTHATCD